MNKLSCGRKSRVEGGQLAGDEWTRHGSFVNKPTRGWLHPDEKVMGPGVSYLVRYMGCVEVLQSMRALDFNTRTQVTREAISLVCDAVPSSKGALRRRKTGGRALNSILGKSNLKFAGMPITLTVSTSSLNLMASDCKQIIANHHMQSISFASGGDPDTADYVAYVAKDPVNQRACHILECPEGLAQDVISTIGQAFELRFKQYLKNPPKLVTPHDRMAGFDGSAWDEEEEEFPDHAYYNDFPGKEPPIGGVVDMRLREGAAPAVPRQSPNHMGATLPVGQVSGSEQDRKIQPQPSAQGRDRFPVPGGKPPNRPDLFDDPSYVNVQNLDKTRQPVRATNGQRDVFDMKPFEDALPSSQAVVTMEEQLKREPWYHGKMARKEAERQLRVNGDFLVRESTTTPGQYVLTGLQNGQPKHLLLVDPEGVVRTKDHRFESGPAYSHLSEFAPPPTPMVDHLVASNPFEDDFGAPKVNAASSPFHNNPVPFGNFRMQGGMPHQVPPGYPGGPQPMRRQPPPFPPNQMGPGFGMPQNPNYGQPGNMNFSSQPFNQPMGQSFSPPAGQMMQGPVGGFGPIMSPTMGQPPRGDMGPGPVLNSPGGPSFPHRFGSPGHPFVQPTMQRPSLPPNTSPFAGADQSFPPGVEDHSKNLNPPTNAFSQDQHVGSPSAVNGNQPNFTPNSATRGNSSTPEVNSIPPPSKPTGNSGHQPPPGLVYPCGACRNEVNDDQDAILCEASCQKWFHRECTGMTESAYSLLTRESSAVWACDYCLKTKDIQSVYIREAMGQLVAANDG